MQLFKDFMIKEIYTNVFYITRYIDYSFISFVFIYMYQDLFWCFDFILHLILPETTVYMYLSTVYTYI